MSSENDLIAIKFEVRGRVQGVNFRHYTKLKADSLRLRGWCFNARDGSVQGHLEGPEQSVGKMTDWLKSEGSPKSVIKSFEIKESKPITDYQYQSFEVIFPRN